MAAVLDEHVVGEALARAHVAMAVFADDPEYLAVNDRYLELTGYTREEIDAHGAGDNLALNSEDQDEFMAIITSAITKERLTSS